MKRRDFLKTAVAAAAGVWCLGNPLTAVGSSLVSPETFRFARIRFSIRGNYIWDYHPEADGYLLHTIGQETGLPVNCSWRSANLAVLPEMTRYPVLFVTTTQEFDPPQNELDNMREYLLRGGFICADDCVNKGYGPRDKFFTSFRRAVNRLFPQGMEKIPLDHDIYHCLHDLPDGVPTMQGKDDGGWGLYIKGRLAVFLSAGDIHCGWQSRYLRENRRGWWFSPEEETKALNMGVNIFTYALSH